MGLFDFFKKKSPEEKTKPDEPKSSALFSEISKYNEYTVRFIIMQQNGNYAPISAYEKLDGEISGFLYIAGEDKSYTLSAEEVVRRMEETFEQKLLQGEIKSYVIYYHSAFANDENHQVAGSDEELKAISATYHFDNGLKGKIGLPYSFSEKEISYQGFAGFTQEENNIIFATKLQEGKNYFQDWEEIKPPVFENNIGLKIKKSNSKHLSNTWSGIFGFENYRQEHTNQILNKHFALALMKKPLYQDERITVSQLEFEDVVFKSIKLNGKPHSILPVVKTDYVVDFENLEIEEWENVNDTEAIIKGRGRDTFGLDYYATDYVENRELYLTQKKLNVKISGIVFVLDVFKEKLDGEIKYSEDFTGYMPSQDLPEYACFDFIGHLEDYKETKLLHDNSLPGYILKMRLITKPGEENFFTIDMYVTPENMRFSELEKGMKLTGLVQMQGEILR